VREFIDIVTEGRVHIVDTGYGPVVRNTRIYENPNFAQSETLAKESFHNGLLYIRGILYKGKTAWVANGGALTHDDLIHQFLPHVDLHGSDITAFVIQNYVMLSREPTIIDVYVRTDWHVGDYDAESNPVILKIIAGCAAAKSSLKEEVDGLPIRLDTTQSEQS